MNHLKQEHFANELEWIRTELNAKNSNFENSNVLILGASGFIGTWLILYFEHLNNNFGVKISITAMRLKRGDHEISELNHSKNIRWLFSNVADYDFKDTEYTHVFFCATPSQPKTGMWSPSQIEESTISGTRNVLRCLAKQKNVPRYINLSSGAVYSLNEKLKSPYSELELVDDDFINSSNVYAFSKYESEKFVNEYTRRGLISGFNARIFSVSGPLLPLDAHFAFGNFLGQAKELREITIKGNPNTSRSYVFITELIYWILLITTRSGFHGSINLGGFEPTTIQNLAQSFLVEFPGTKVVLENSSEAISNYYPKMNFLEKSFGLTQRILINEQISRHHTWLNQF